MDVKWIYIANLLLKILHSYFNTCSNKGRVQLPHEIKNILKFNYWHIILCQSREDIKLHWSKIPYRQSSVLTVCLCLNICRLILNAIQCLAMYGMQ